MAFSLLDKKNREMFLQDIKSDENRARKEKSLKDFDVLSNNLEPYVRDYLLSQFSEQTVLEMPVVSSINLALRVSHKEASLYANPPSRTFSGLTDEQATELTEKYKEWKVNQKLFKSNVHFKMQQQSNLMVVPKENKLELRVLMGHHYDVVPDEMDPERVETIVISSFDKAQARVIQGDLVDQKSADAEDYKSTLKRNIAWDKDYNFVFDDKAGLKGEVVENPLKEYNLMPFIDIAYEKDFEYFVKSGQTLSDFAIQYLGALSDLYNIMKMQGYSQAYLKGPKAMMPVTGIKLGPSYLLRLPTDGIDDKQVEFGYASPNSDLAGSISFLEVLLSNFLTSRGLDPNTVNGKMQAQKYSSGVERLLSMIESFEASRADMDLYQQVEYKLFELVKAWSQITLGTDSQILSFAIPDEASLYCEFNKPEIIQTEMDKLNLIARKLELNLITEQQAIMDLYEVDEAKADELILELNGQMKAPQLKEKDVTEKIPK